jgi:S1-C subfamily serine protease
MVKVKTLVKILVAGISILALIFIVLIFSGLSFVKEEVEKNAKISEEKITLLQKQIETLDNQIDKITGENKKVALSLKEIENKQSIKPKTQEELVTTAVAKVAPSVVSIVAVKDVPKVEVIYQNPFGNDPLFKDFDIQVPVLKQKGSERKQVGAGTGFVITGDGYVVTNKHVVSDTNATYSIFMPDTTVKEAFVVYKDEKNDVALLKISGTNYKKVSLGDSSSAKLGQTVIAIGNALGQYDNSVSIGIISGLNRKIEATDGNNIKEILDGVIQTDAAINPGNSGGPLIDTEGKVIGINVATVVGSNNISFSIPINSVKEAIKNYLPNINF